LPRDGRQRLAHVVSFSVVDLLLHTISGWSSTPAALTVSACVSMGNDV
jgi:hypothetical protein